VDLDILFFFFNVFDKKLINNTKSGCEGQLSEIIFSGAKIH
jgi:hypothetical protein